MRFLKPINVKKLGIIANGDPRSGKTWSGTPRNLIQALEAAGATCEASSLSKHRRQGLIGRHLKKFSTVSVNLSKVGTRHTLDEISRHFLDKGCHSLLHLPGNLAMPYAGSDTGLRHFGFFDSTFRQFWIPWLEHRYAGLKGIKKRLLAWENRRRDAFYGESVRNFDHVFVTTDWVKESLIEDYAVNPDRISVTYTGSGSVRDLEIGYKERSQRLLFVAKHNYLHKGARLLLDAFRVLRERHGTAELVMVGPVPDAIGALPDEERVTFHSYLEWEALEMLFNHAAVFVMPSLYEPYGLVYLEALRCGTPVICSSTGGMSAIVEKFDCGWSVPEGSEVGLPNQLAGIMQEALENAHESERRGRNGRKFVQSHCSWEKCAEIILKRIEDES